MHTPAPAALPCASHPRPSVFEFVGIDSAGGEEKGSALVRTLGGEQGSRGQKILLPATSASHSKRCPERRPILTITALASVEYMAGVRLCLSLLRDPQFAGPCLRATARTSGLAGLQIIRV